MLGSDTASAAVAAIAASAADNDWSVFDENAWLGIKGLLAVAAAGLVGRLLLQTGRIRFGRRPSAYELAYLSGEARWVTYTALAALRAYGVLSVTRYEIREPTLEVTGPPPPDADPVEVGMHRVVAQGVWRDFYHASDAVRSATGPVVEQLRRDGLLFTRRRRRFTRTASAAHLTRTGCALARPRPG